MNITTDIALSVLASHLTPMTAELGNREIDIDHVIEFPSDYKFVKLPNALGVETVYLYEDTPALITHLLENSQEQIDLLEGILADNLSESDQRGVTMVLDDVKSDDVVKRTNAALYLAINVGGLDIFTNDQYEHLVSAMPKVEDEVTA